MTPYTIPNLIFDDAVCLADTMSKAKVTIPQPAVGALVCKSVANLLDKARASDLEIPNLMSALVPWRAASTSAFNAEEPTTWILSGLEFFSDNDRMEFFSNTVFNEILQPAIAHGAPRSKFIMSVARQLLKKWDEAG